MDLDLDVDEHVVVVVQGGSGVDNVQRPEPSPDVVLLILPR